MVKEDRIKEVVLMEKPKAPEGVQEGEVKIEKQKSCACGKKIPLLLLNRGSEKCDVCLDKAVRMARLLASQKLATV